ncbi:MULTISPECIES: REP-associated tyrosine transposase [Methylomicrobium]|uniref:Transposase n=1 Tax=Methylomicrobium album BG8 TaxID=686340 RepID=H8GQQ6_METAL|nr:MULTISPECIES: transposase [Methylomicrobium]EIC31041.1 transposase [Methylomicrobium album BG8]
MPYDDLRKGRFNESSRAYFVTTVLAEREAAYFRDFHCARLAIAQMRNLHDAGAVDSLAWVVMSDHVHWLFRLGETHTLSEIMKAYKARAAHLVNGYLNRQGAVWQKAFYDHALREEEDVRAIARYIVANPLRAGLVENIGDYPHWDAIWL